MAKATKQVAITETLTGVTLELSVQEVRTLAVILQHVGGSPKTTRRRDAAAISNALDALNIPCEHPRDWLEEHGRNIYFTPASLEDSHD